MSLSSRLAAIQPAIHFSHGAVRVLTSPPDFHARLLDICRRAHRRIFLSSLYLAPSLIPPLDAALRTNSRLRLHLSLDYNRATRPGPDASATTLLPLLRAHPDRVHVALFRSPNPVSALTPPRFNESWGTWHPKIYGADDDVIISGANLNTSYFTNRQDRYFYFTALPRLADYCFSFLKLMSSFSYTLLPSLDTPAIQWPHASVHPWKIQSKLHHALSHFQAAHISSSHHTDDTVLFPVIQGGQFNIREEERVLSTIFNHLPSTNGPTPAITWTSGYFGIYTPYQDLILKSPASCHVIVASPKANGFYGSGGLSGLIPEGYTLLEQRFMRAASDAGRISDHRKDAVSLSEWERQDWTYHAKGIWLSPSEDSPPTLTMFGSTNLNSRSANLDTELSFVMMTSSQALQKTLRDEVRNLQQWAGPWRGQDRKVRLRTKAIVGLVGGML